MEQIWYIPYVQKHADLQDLKDENEISNLQSLLKRERAKVFILNSALQVKNQKIRELKKKVTEISRGDSNTIVVYKEVIQSLKESLNNLPNKDEFNKISAALEKERKQNDYLREELYCSRNTQSILEREILGLNGKN